jgi:hypothetical protein
MNTLPQAKTASNLTRLAKAIAYHNARYHTDERLNQ